MEVSMPLDQKCSNCETQLAGRFCAACGQEHFGHEPTLKELLSDVWANTFSIDGRLFRTLKAMFVSPGKLTLEYFEGRRVRYSTPFKLYLTCSAAYFLVANFSDIQMRITRNGKPATTKEVTEETGKLVLQIVQEGTAYFFNHVATIFLFVVPLTALSTALLFLGRKKNLLYHLVFVLHVWSAVFLLGAMVNVLHLHVNFFAILFLGGFLYSIFACMRAFRAKWYEATPKALIFSFSSLVLMLLPLMGIITYMAVQKKAQGMHLSSNGGFSATTTTTTSNNAPGK